MVLFTKATAISIINEHANFCAHYESDMCKYSTCSFLHSLSKDTSDVSSVNRFIKMIHRHNFSHYLQKKIHIRRKMFSVKIVYHASSIRYSLRQKI